MLASLPRRGDPGYRLFTTPAGVGADTTRSSTREDVAQPLHRRLPSDLADRVRQRDLLRAHLDAVLRVAAVGDAAGFHQDREALLRVHRARRVEVHEQRLPDDRRADEAAVAVHLRADLETERARDAAVERVAELLQLGRDARAGAEVVGAVDGYPRLHALQRFEHPAPVDD